MLSSIFVDRPRLAIVIAIVMVLAGLIAMMRIPIAQFPDIVPPQVSVTARFPGASADVVEATIAQPIEAQMNGVENMLYMKSVSGNDGSYSLSVYFAVGTNPDINTVNVQNRVSLAEPKIPIDVRKQGLTVRKQSPALLQMIAVYSPDSSRDALFLSNYAIINIIDSLARTRGVGLAQLYSVEDYSMRIWFFTDVLTSLNIAPSDVINAIQSQNVQAAIGRIGAAPMPSDQELQLSLQTQGRLVTDRGVRQALSFAPIPMAPSYAYRTLPVWSWVPNRAIPQAVSMVVQTQISAFSNHPEATRWRPRKSCVKRWHPSRSGFPRASTIKSRTIRPYSSRIR